MTILVTGGAGFIGSHTIVQLLENNHTVVAVDNLSNSSQEAINRIEVITGKTVIFRNIDVRDRAAISSLFSEFSFESVIHFAGLKAVGESIDKPILYYNNNLQSLIVLCEIMAEHKVNNLIFSSSATVYGSQASVPIDEDASLFPTNPYGHTKAMGEQILRGVAKADSEMKIVILRYFNPAGAHPSGLLGESPAGIPNNLLPYIAQVAVGLHKELPVMGHDFDTPDGTGIRDYLHVQDLANAHMKALDAPHKNNQVAIYNLGTGKGYSVLEMVQAFEKASGQKIPYSFKPRRAGDIATCYANPNKANTELGWYAKKSIDDMCKDAWTWQQKNPNGYKGDENAK